MGTDSPILRSDAQVSQLATRFSFCAPTEGPKGRERIHSAESGEIRGLLRITPQKWYPLFPLVGHADFTFALADWCPWSSLTGSP